MGIFSGKKPSRAEQRQIVAANEKATAVFLHLARSGGVQFSDGREVVLSQPGHAKEVLAAMERGVAALGLGSIPPYSIDAVNERARLVHAVSHATTYEKNGPIIELSQLIVGGLNYHELLCFHYYERFPTYEPLREIIDNGVKVMAHTLRPVFGESLPDFVRLAFPRFSEHYSKIFPGG